jgi:hypothetical protein
MGILKNMKMAAKAMQPAMLWIFVFGFGSGLLAADHQKPCGDARAYFHDALAHVKLLDRKGVVLDKAYEQKSEELLKIAVANPGCLFNAISDVEALSLIKALSRLEEKSVSIQILLWDSFLKRYPGSTHLDEAQWLRARTEATPYEYEGFADAALQQIGIIRKFISQSPTNSYIPAAKLELARAYRIAYETYRYGGGLTTAPNENRKKVGLKYRDHARLLLQNLCHHSSGATSSEACRALHDLSKGVCVYAGPGSPNPHVTDNWAVPH